jgi:hypothetical protein
LPRGQTKEIDVLTGFSTSALDTNTESPEPSEWEGGLADAESTFQLEPREGVLADLADELRWTFGARKGWLIGIAFNLVLAGIYVGYTHYHPHSRDPVDITGLATGVVAWVLSDVVNTNQMGSDAARVRASIERGDSVARILALKTLGLAVLLAPLAATVSVVARLLLDRWRFIPWAVMMDMDVLFAWLGVGCVASVLFPYNPIPLRERIRLRRSWLRWGFCLAVPYLLYPAIGYICAWPPDRFARHFIGDPHVYFTQWAVCYMVWGFVVWGIGLGIAQAYSHVKSHRLLVDLDRSAWAQLLVSQG